MGSIINKEKLLSGIIFGDLDNEEYVYMPGGEIGSPSPICVFDRNGIILDVSLEEAAEAINHFHLKPLKIEPFSKI